MMNRKKKNELRQRQSTRQLMGIVKITPHGVQTEAGERVFYLIRPDNLSVLSPEVIRSRIRSLTVLLSTQPALEILALDSRESFQRNKEYYQRRIEEEPVPEVRELLEKDLPQAAIIETNTYYEGDRYTTEAGCSLCRRPYSTSGPLRDKPQRSRRRRPGEIPAFLRA